jgi:raffinose/stachyose/melibiose transport system permease protein
VAPALAVYAAFVLFPLLQSVQYSFYNWDGIGVASWVGLRNWESLFTDPQMVHSIVNAFVLIVFYTALPICLGLIAAALIRQVKPGPFGTVTRVALFVPQVIPLVAAGIAWSWLYSQSGLVNQFLDWIRLGSIGRAWLGDFTFALPAVGIIGVWVMLGFCTVLLLSGMGKIEPSLYEAARLDGAGSVAEFFAVTLPGLRQEIVVCITFTMIAALTSFDIIQVSTQGGPGYQTLVPGVAVYRLAFLDQHLGQASALAIFLTLVVLAIIIPIQRLRRTR